MKHDCLDRGGSAALEHSIAVEVDFRTLAATGQKAPGDEAIRWKLQVRRFPIGMIDSSSSRKAHMFRVRR